MLAKLALGDADIEKLEQLFKSEAKGNFRSASGDLFLKEPPTFSTYNSTRAWLIGLRIVSVPSQMLATMAMAKMQTLKSGASFSIRGQQTS